MSEPSEPQALGGLGLALDQLGVDLSASVLGTRSAATEALFSPRKDVDLPAMESGVLWKSSGKSKEPGLFQKRFFQFLGAELQYYRTSVQTPARVYFLYATTLEERDRWILSIRRRVAEQDQDSPRSRSLLEGHLHKCSGNPLVKELQRRFFVLQADTLSYYRPKQGVPAGVIHLTEVEDVTLAEELTRAKFMFTLTTAKRSYHLFSETTEEREAWVSALRSAAPKQAAGTSAEEEEDPYTELTDGSVAEEEAASDRRSSEPPPLVTADETHAEPRKKKLELSHSMTVAKPMPTRAKAGCEESIGSTPTAPAKTSPDVPTETNFLGELSEGMGKFGSMVMDTSNKLVRNLIPAKKRDTVVEEELRPPEECHEDHQLSCGKVHVLCNGVEGANDGEFWPYHLAIEGDELVYYKRERSVALSTAHAAHARRSQAESQFFFELLLESSAERFCVSSEAERHQWVSALSARATHQQLSESDEADSTTHGGGCRPVAAFRDGYLTQTTLEELVHTTIAVSPEEFFVFTWSDKARPLLERYHEKRGDANLRCDGWQDGAEWGHTQFATFETPVVTPLKTSSSRMDEKMRYHLTPERFLLEIIGKLYTCPYADSFLVEQRFEVTSNGDGTSTLIISSALNFVKSTIFKGKITDQTLKQSRASYEMWTTLAREAIAKGQQEKSFGGDHDLDTAVLHHSWEVHHKALQELSDQSKATESPSPDGSPLSRAPTLVVSIAASAAGALLLVCLVIYLNN